LALGLIFIRNSRSSKSIVNNSPKRFIPMILEGVTRLSELKSTSQLSHKCTRNNGY